LFGIALISGLLGIAVGTSCNQGPAKPDAGSSSTEAELASGVGSLPSAKGELGAPHAPDSGSGANSPVERSGAQDGPPEKIRELEGKLRPAGAEPRPAAPAIDPASRESTRSPEALSAPASEPGTSTTAGTPESEWSAKEATRLLDEFKSAVDSWVVAIDKDDARAVEGFLVSDEFLQHNINPGHYTILSGTLIPKNQRISAELLRIAREHPVRVLSWKPGTPSKTVVTKSIFTAQLPLITASILELSIGDVPVELELRQSVKTEGGWKIMDLSIRG
jgi:hypothetical protein